jgi:uncharacterized cupredoxin-like copper-binding protein
LILLTTGGLCTSEALGADQPSEETVIVVIQGRQFKPERTVLHQGHKTRLVFKNQDSELHAMVPIGLFSGESLNVAGNGAPEFGPEGLKRVLIPPDGIAEIHFTPNKPGEYRYLCDMPGHEMKGLIVVE